MNALAEIDPATLAPLPQTSYAAFDKRFKVLLMLHCLAVVGWTHGGFCQITLLLAASPCCCLARAALHMASLRLSPSLIRAASTMMRQP